MSAPSNATIERLLSEFLELQEKYLDAKTLLKSYKVHSDHLKELKLAYKNLKAQIDEEKLRIENEFNEDEDYVKAKEQEIEYTEKMREKAAELRATVSKMDIKDDIAKFEFKIKEEPTQVQIEKISKLYVNGKEQK